MKRSCISAATAATLIVSTATFAAGNEVEIEHAKYRLGNPACGVSASAWELSSGPSSALVTNSGDNSYVEMFESGNYEFSRTCCEVVNGQGYGSPLSRVNALMSSSDRVGFGENTSGGAEATQYTVVTSLADSGNGTLRDALRGNSPSWIIFDESIHGGTITLNSIINVTSGDITIDGAGADITVSVNRSATHPIFTFRGGNTIIHGITIDGNGSKATSMMLRQGKNYWVDHVTITNNDGDDALGIGQGNLGDESASEVTVSNFHVYNATYGILSGGENYIDDYPAHRTTIHSSNLSARDRNPRIKNNGTTHLFNNYVHSFIYLGMHSGTDTVIYANNNVYSAARANNKSNALAAGSTKDSGEPGVAYSAGNMFIDGAETGDRVSDVSASSFNLPYQYTVMPASDVVDHVLANAGADNAIDPDSAQYNSGSSGSTSCSVDTRALVYTAE